MNNGFEDARNLGWKLAGTLEGWGGAGLLDSYDSERRPVFRSTALDFIERFISDDRAFLRAHAPGRDRAGFERAWGRRVWAVQTQLDQTARRFGIWPSSRCRIISLSWNRCADSTALSRFVGRSRKRSA